MPPLDLDWRNIAAGVAIAFMLSPFFRTFARALVFELRSRHHG